MTKLSKHYVAATFALTYLLWGSLVFLTQYGVLKYGEPIFMVMFLIGGNAPPICAIIMKKKYSSPEDFKVFLKNIINPKHNIGWYLLTVVLAAACSVLSMLISGGKIGQPLYMILVYIPMMIVGGGLEEIGWRGILLPSLLEKLKPVNASLILGAVWTSWHIPLFYIIGTYQQTNMILAGFLLTTMAFTFLLTFIYCRTKSIFMCIIFHALLNSMNEVFMSNASLLASFAVLAFGVCAFFALEIICGKAKNDNSEI